MIKRGKGRKKLPLEESYELKEILETGYLGFSLIQVFGLLIKLEWRAEYSIYCGLIQALRNRKVKYRNHYDWKKNEGTVNPTNFQKCERYFLCINNSLSPFFFILNENKTFK